MTPEEPVAPEEVSASCYAPESVGEIGTESGCNGMLIVDNAMLRSNASSMVGGDASFEITHGGVSYTFSDSEYNIFTGQVSDFSRVFFNELFNENIGYWDTSNAVTMFEMFYQSPFNKDIGNWNTSSLINAEKMFMRASFNQDISGWDTFNIDNMNYMFMYAGSFNQDLSCWDVSRIAEPTAFSRYATAWTLPKPVWGTTGCH